jgi:hypothetical protein
MENENIEKVVTNSTIISTSSPVKVGEWVWTILIASIPLVGLIMLFVWAFSQAENPSKANWAKAMLLWMLIGCVLAGLIMLLFVSAFVSSIKSGSFSL